MNVPVVMLCHLPPRHETLLGEIACGIFQFRITDLRSPTIDFNFSDHDLEKIRFFICAPSSL